MAKVATLAEIQRVGERASGRESEREWERELAVNLPLLLFLKRFSISPFSASVYLRPLSLFLSLFAFVVIAAIEVLFYAQFVCCGA